MSDGCKSWETGAWSWRANFYPNQISIIISTSSTVPSWDKEINNSHGVPSKEYIYQKKLFPNIPLQFNFETIYRKQKKLWSQSPRVGYELMSTPHCAHYKKVLSERGNFQEKNASAILNLLSAKDWENLSWGRNTKVKDMDSQMNSTWIKYRYIFYVQKHRNAAIVWHGISKQSSMNFCRITCN